MKERDDRFYLLHILECIANIEHGRVSDDLPALKEQLTRILGELRPRS